MAKNTQVNTQLSEGMQQAIGKAGVSEIDLTNTVAMGEAVLQGKDNVDAFTSTLVDRIGRTDYFLVKHEGILPSIVRDENEFASIQRRVYFDYTEPEANNAYSLKDGTEYKRHLQFKKPKITVKNFNTYDAFSRWVSFPWDQIKSAFLNTAELNAFETALTSNMMNNNRSDTNKLAMFALSNMIATVAYKELGSTFTGTTGVQAVNVLKLYRDFKNNQELTYEQIKTDPEFIRWFNYRVILDSEKLRAASTLYNADGLLTDTPKSNQDLIMLSEVNAAAKMYLYADVFHDEYVKLGNVETVPYWQGTGTEGKENGNIVIKPSGISETITLNNVLAVLKDHDSVAATVAQNKTYSDSNIDGEFTNTKYSYNAMYLNDTARNFIVYYAM